MLARLLADWNAFDQIGYARSILVAILNMLNGDMMATLPHVTFYVNVGLAWNPAFLGSLTANLRLTSTYSSFHGRIAL